MRGLHDRPWSPAHLRVSSVEDGLALRWIPRSRLHGDVWEGNPPGADPLRFRVRVMEGEVERRTFEVDGCDALYVEADLAADFPEGPGVDASIEVEQHGAVFGWGVATRVAIPG